MIEGGGTLGTGKRGVGRKRAGQFYDAKHKVSRSLNREIQLLRDALR